MATLRVKNWKEYQGYEKRGPRWIKLHAAVLSNPDWIVLPVVARALLPALWIVASGQSNEGTLPADVRLLAILAHVPESEVLEGLPALISFGFLQCDGAVAGLATDVSGEKSRERVEKRESREELRTESINHSGPRVVNERSPHIAQGQRPLWETEALRLTREIAEAEGADGAEVIAAAADYPGATRTKTNPATMTEARLVATVLALRKRAAKHQPAVETPPDPAVAWLEAHGGAARLAVECCEATGYKNLARDWDRWRPSDMPTAAYVRVLALVQSMVSRAERERVTA